MDRLKSILGNAWAITAIPIILATFIGMNFWAKGMATATGVTISPWYSAGDVMQTIQHPGYRTIIHRPVFMGLFGETKNGFVQINWAPDEKTVLPTQIDEDIDLTGNGTPSFHIHVNTDTDEAALTIRTPQVINIETVLRMDKERAVRIQLHNPSGKWPFTPSWS